jgi:hypothetical protein
MSNTSLAVRGSKAIAKVVEDVYDEEGNLMEFSESDKRYALHLHNEIINSTIKISEALAEIKGKKLYLALGARSWKHYVIEYCKFNISQANKYALIGERKTATMVAVSDTNKLYDLARLPEVEYDVLVEEKAILLASGELITEEDIQAMPRSEVKKLVNAIKKSRLDDSVEGWQESEAEKREYEEKVKELKKRRKVEEENIRVLGKEIAEIEEKMEKLKAKGKDYEVAKLQVTIDELTKELAELKAEREEKLKGEEAMEAIDKFNKLIDEAFGTIERVGITRDMKEAREVGNKLISALSGLQSRVVISRNYFDDLLDDVLRFQALEE